MPDPLLDIADIDHIGQTDLDKFFARPIRLFHDTWDNLIADTSYPWADYLNNSLVATKLSTFGYLRARLHIKIVVNSTPFNFGAMQVAYYPYNLDQSSIGYGISDTLATKVPASMHKYLQSTLPHVVLEASTCKGGEIIAPFIYDRNWLELKNLQGIESMGILSFRELVPLANANGNTAAATITVYAWMEDVKLTGTTSASILQSDVYGQGVISKPASIVANAAKALSSAPIIGKYAMATQIAATAVGRVASMFGFSNVPLIDPIRNVRNAGIGNLASAEIGSHIEKLSLDPKNEITIDPTSLGATKDEMLISDIVQREGLAGIASWSTTTAVDTQIASTKVGVDYVIGATSGGYTGRYFVPLTHVSRAFQYWRGDIIYRFKAICTPYHKGRLRISWDTLAQPSRTADGYQNSLTMLWDLSDTHEVEFAVPYQNETAFLPTSNSLAAAGWNVTENASLTDDPTSNGIVSIVVVNALTAPVDSSTIQIIMYVRGAGNMEFAVPINIVSNSVDAGVVSFLEPQSNIYQLQSETVTVAYKNDQRNDENIYKVHFGEVVKSLKVLMYRSNFYYAGSFGSTTAGDRSQLSLPRVPLHFGYDYNGINSARNQAGTANFNYNWVAITPYHWFSVAYVFQRGGHNYRITLRDTKGAIQVARVPYTGTSGLTTNSYRTAANSSYDSNGRGQVINSPVSLTQGQGGAVAISAVNPTVEVCSPFYSRYRAITNNPRCVNLPPYSYASAYNANTAIASGDENKRMGNNLEGIMLSAYNNAASQIPVEIYHSVGVDFSLSFYRGCPCLFVQSQPAAPV